MILVTGGTGLLGAHLLLHLLQSGAAVKAIHREKSNLKEVEKVFGYYTDQSHTLFQKIIFFPAQSEGRLQKERDNCFRVFNSRTRGDRQDTG